MADLFTRAPTAPLAELLRPTSLEEVVGQSHLVGPGAPLRLAFASGRLPSMVLWGPPGVGKTSLARLASRLVDAEFVALSAVTAGVKEIREAAEQAQRVLDHRDRRTVLFIDEIHRLNKGQQDALLPHVESGLVTLIGATTENPSFEVNAALLSRTQVFVLKTLEAGDLRALYERARARLPEVEFEPDALQSVIDRADGDARRFLGLLEHLAFCAQGAGSPRIDAAFVLANAGGLHRRFDKGGDALYDTISAFQKCIRGSDPNAALYWLARLLDGGADARYVARRLIVMASEEVGNADPRALQVATSAALAYERLGSPEGDLALAQAAVYIAVAPKSNAVYTAWKAARAFVAQDSTREVPMHLRNAPTALLAAIGAHEGYRYAHDEPDAFAAGEHYFPMDVPEQLWYQPRERGLEIRIGEKLRHLQGLNEAARSAGTARAGAARASTPASAPASTTAAPARQRRRP